MQKLKRFCVCTSTCSFARQFHSAPSFYRQSPTDAKLKARLRKILFVSPKKTNKRTSSRKEIDVSIRSAEESIRETLHDIDSAAVALPLKARDLNATSLIDLFNKAYDNRQLSDVETIKVFLLMTYKVRDPQKMKSIIDRSMECLQCFFRDEHVVPSDLLFSVITFYIKKGVNGHAIYLYERLKGYQAMTPLLMNHFINLAIRQKQIDLADYLFQDAREMGIRFSRTHFQYSISAYVHVSNFAKAMEIFTYMSQANETIDAPIYTLLLENLKKQIGNDPNVSQYVSQILDSLEGTPLEFSERLFSSILNILGELGNVRGAREWFSKLLKSDVQFDQRSINGVLVALGKNAMFEHAFMLVKDMEAKLNIPPNTVTMNTLMNCAQTSEQLSAVIAAVRKIKNVPLDVFSYTTMIKILCRHGMVQEALDVYQIMQNDSNTLPSSATIYTLVNANKHNRDIVLQLYNDTKEKQIEQAHNLRVCFTIFCEEYRQDLIELLIHSAKSFISEYNRRYPDVLPTLFFMMYKVGDKRVETLSKKVSALGLNIVPQLMSHRESVH